MSIAVTWSSVPSRQQLTSLLLDGSTVANYRADVGVTGTLNASAWANQIGAAGPLLQASGPAQPTINADGSLTGDGIAQFMESGAFVLAQPNTIYIVFKPITFIDGSSVFSSLATTSGFNVQITQRAPTPNFALYAGSGVVAANTNATLGADHVLTAGLNGASSFITIDSTATTTGNPGTDSFDSFSLFHTPGSFGNFQVKEIIARNVADSAATQAQIQSLLRSIYGTP